MNKRVSMAEWWLPSAEPMLKADNARNVEYARFFSRSVSQDTLVGVFWAGVMPYYCDRPMLDMLGKADRHIAKGRAVQNEPYTPGHAKRDWDYVLETRRPDILMSEMPEMQHRADYVRSYCVPELPLWIALRRDSMRKLLLPGVACAPLPG